MKQKKRVGRDGSLARGKTARRKPAGGKIAKRKIAGLQASGYEELQSSAALAYQAGRRPRKKRITLFLDADVLAWFKESGPRYQTRINRALWKVMREERRN